MNTTQKQLLTRVFDSYDQMTNMRKRIAVKRRAEREHLFNRFDGLRVNTIDPELNELAEAIKARGHHARVFETPPSEQSPPAVHLVVSRAGEVKEESPEDQNRLTCRPDAGNGRDGGRVVILDSTKGNFGDPIEVGNVSLEALSRRDVANRAIAFAARVIEVRPTGPTAQTVENEDSNMTESPPCQQLTQASLNERRARQVASEHRTAVPATSLAVADRNIHPARSPQRRRPVLRVVYAGSGYPAAIAVADGRREHERRLSLSLTQITRPRCR